MPLYNMHSGTLRSSCFQSHHLACMASRCGRLLGLCWMYVFSGMHELGLLESRVVFWFRQFLKDPPIQRVETILTRCRRGFSASSSAVIVQQTFCKLFFNWRIAHCTMSWWFCHAKIVSRRHTCVPAPYPEPLPTSFPPYPSVCLLMMAFTASNNTSCNTFAFLRKLISEVEAHLLRYCFGTALCLSSLEMSVYILPVSDFLVLMWLT